MMNTQVKQDYSIEIAKFVANGGVISPAINTNKVEFNPFNHDAVARNSEKPNSYQNHILRKRAEKEGLKSYKPIAPCNGCKTQERSVKSNACLECDRRRFRAKVGMNESKLSQVAEYLLGQNKDFSFTSGGKKYVLKVEAT